MRDSLGITMVELLHVYSLGITMVVSQHAYTLLVSGYYGWITTRLHVTRQELLWLNCYTCTCYFLRITMVGSQHVYTLLVSGYYG